MLGKAVLQLMVAALSLALGCRAATEVSLGRNLALATTVDPKEFIVVDLDDGGVVGRPPSGLEFQEDARALPSDSTQLLYSGAGILVGFNLQAQTIAWTEQLGAGQEQRFNGQSIYANFAIAFSPDGQKILLADSYLQSAPGVAVLDAPTRAATGWIGPLRALELFTVSAGIIAPDAGVLAFGNRSLTPSSFETERRKGRLYFLAGSPMEIRDSLDVLSISDTASGGVVDAAISADSRFIYFVTYGKVLRKYDLATRSHAGTINVPVYGPLAVTTAGVVLADGSASRDDPGSGTIVVVDAQLQTAEPISLADASYDHVLPVLRGIAISLDGRYAYVGAGTPETGPLFGSQPGRLLIVDLQLKKLVRVIDTQTWGVRSILPLR